MNKPPTTNHPIPLPQLLYWLLGATTLLTTLTLAGTQILQLLTITLWITHLILIPWILYKITTQAYNIIKRKTPLPVSKRETPTPDQTINDYNLGMRAGKAARTLLNPKLTTRKRTTINT